MTYCVGVLVREGLVTIADTAVARRDALACELTYRIEEGEPYFRDLRESWSSALRAAHLAIRQPPYPSK